MKFCFLTLVSFVIDSRFCFRIRALEGTGVGGLSECTLFALACPNITVDPYIDCSGLSLVVSRCLAFVRIGIDF